MESYAAIDRLHHTQWQVNENGTDKQLSYIPSQYDAKPRAKNRISHDAKNLCGGVPDKSMALYEREKHSGLGEMAASVPRKRRQRLISEFAFDNVKDHRLARRSELAHKRTA